MRFILLLLCTVRFLVADPPQSSTNSTKPDEQQPADIDDPCHRLQDEGATKFQVRCVGKLRSRLLLITDNYLVYDLPLDSLSATIDRLYINTSKPMPLAEKWPILESSADFVRAREKFYNCFTALDADSEYILFTTKYDNCKCAGATYDLDRSEAFAGLAYYGHDDQVLISSNELTHFYAINKLQGRGLEIMRFHFTQSQVKGSGIIPDANNTFYSMCMVSEKQIKIVRTPTAECRPLQWPVLKGFIADQKFYLFGSNYIFTFPKEVYDQPDQSVQFQSIPYGQFIQCTGNVTPKAIMAREAAPTKWGLIIAIILLLLLCCLCCLLFLMRKAFERRRKAVAAAAAAASSKKNSTEPATKGGAQTPSTKPKVKSVRSSAGAQTFGLLTPHRSKGLSNKTARSSGASKGKPLSKRSKNKTKSARTSSGPGGYGRLSKLSKKKSSSATKPVTKTSRGNSKKSSAKTTHSGGTSTPMGKLTTKKSSTLRKGVTRSARSSSLTKPSKLLSKARSGPHSSAAAQLNTARSKISKTRPHAGT